jgi:hypothetical protein
MPRDSPSLDKSKKGELGGEFISADEWQNSAAKMRRWAQGVVEGVKNYQQ